MNPMTVDLRQSIMGTNCKWFLEKLGPYNARELVLELGGMEFRTTIPDFTNKEIKEASYILQRKYITATREQQLVNGSAQIVFPELPL